jgi:hypothetical protein
VVSSVIGLSSSDKAFEFSFVAHMNSHAASLIGIWVDGVENADNTMATNNAELLCQFGISGGKWRVRGANGVNSTTTTDNVPTTAGSTPEMKVVLDIDLRSFSGDGQMDLSIYDLDSGNLYRVISDVHLGLLAQSSMFSDPSNYTGWWIRSQASGVSTETMTLDDFTVTVPEPATMSLLVLGGLACLRRRR